MTERIYLVANNYMDAIEYRHAKDLCAHTTRYVSCAAVLNGLDKPRVIVLGDAKLVPDAIVDALARHQAEVTYDSL